MAGEACPRRPKWSLSRRGARCWPQLRLARELTPPSTHHAINGKSAASQIGDDTLQRRSRGTVVPESFTHGTSAQRVSWFKRGVEGGQIDSCDTFAARDL